MTEETNYARNQYNPYMSSTYRPDGKSANINYVDGTSAEGSMVIDTVQVCYTYN